MVKKRKLIYSLYEKTDLDEVLNFLNVECVQPEIILGFREISRLWNWSLEECVEVAKLAKKRGVKIFLQWDILMTESSLMAISTHLKNQNFLNHKEFFDGIRVQDSGALQNLLEWGYDGEIHFIVEQGNHNLFGLQTWLEYSSRHISRLVLSPELPAKVLKEFSSHLDCELEYLGFGPILLFYTPRNLVKPLYETDDDEVQVIGTSEESPHKGFPIRDNRHGTFMFNIKDQYIFDEKELSEITDFTFRMDFIEGKGDLDLKNVDLGDFKSVTQAYKRPTTKGFFRTNKTDVLFKKLKNNRLQSRDDSLLGEVVDVKKKYHIGVYISHPKYKLKIGDTLTFLSPEGREKKLKVNSIKDADGLSKDVGGQGEVVFLSHVGGLSIKSLVFKE